MPFKKGQGGRPKGVTNKATREIKDVARTLIEDHEYLEMLAVRLRNGTAGAIEPLLFHYLYGKPKERIELEANTPMPLVIELITNRTQLADVDTDAGDDPDA